MSVLNLTSVYILMRTLRLRGILLVHVAVNCHSDNILTGVWHSCHCLVAHCCCSKVFPRAYFFFLPLSEEISPPTAVNSSSCSFTRSDDFASLTAFSRFNFSSCIRFWDKGAFLYPISMGSLIDSSLRGPNWQVSASS